MLNLAGDLGLDGVLFELSPFSSFRDHDLETIRMTAEDKGLYVEFGMGSIFRWHPMAEKGRALLAEAGYDVDVPPAQLVIHHLKIAEKLGSPMLRCVGGNLFTRDEGHDMAALADHAVRDSPRGMLRAADMGMKIAMENHADFTVRELASILARVNSPAFGFTVDCANLAFDLDDPLRLARIMAPHAVTTHFKNYRIIRTDAGLALENCALGEGDIDLVAIAEILRKHRPDLNLNIEIHSQFAPFRLDVLDGTFAAAPFAAGRRSGLVLREGLEKDGSLALPAGLPDGAEAWQLEYEHLSCRSAGPERRWVTCSPLKREERRTDR